MTKKQFKNYLENAGIKFICTVSYAGDKNSRIKTGFIFFVNNAKNGKRILYNAFVSEITNKMTFSNISVSYNDDRKARTIEEVAEKMLNWESWDSFIVDGKLEAIERSDLSDFLFGYDDVSIIFNM